MKYTLDNLSLAQVCPKRTTNRGSKPTVKSLIPQEASKRNKNWSSPEHAPNEDKKY